VTGRHTAKVLDSSSASAVMEQWQINKIRFTSLLETV